MRKVLEILKGVQSTQGTNSKIELLSRYVDNTLLQATLRLVYDPNISTKISRAKVSKKVKISDSLKMGDVEFLVFLSTKCSGKDSDIGEIHKYIESFPKEFEDLLKDIVGQTLTLGMDVKNINKAYGYPMISIPLIPMLAYPLDTKINKIPKDTLFEVTTKLDGFRCLIRYNVDGTIEGFSRNGLPLEGFEDFLQELKTILPYQGFVYDGELLTQKCYSDSQEGYRALTKIVRRKGIKNKDDLCLHCFDIIPIQDMLKMVGSDTYSQRREKLNSISESNYLKVVKSLGVTTLHDPLLTDIMDKALLEGKEGLMLNSVQGVYECKRSLNILKMKKFWTCDLRVLRVEEGQGSLCGSLGSVVVDYKGFEVSVGSGFTLEERSELWVNKEDLLGKIIEVSYFEETSNDKGGTSLRFPIFKGIRTDKNEPSYN
ncbi:MAG: hypothetical protein ACRCZ0_08250 [Cetobacterium sp.]